MMKRFATVIFRFRLPLLLLLGVLTLYLGYQASRLKVATDFSKMIPTKHQYIKNYTPFKAVFGGGNQIKVEVSRKNGDILSYEFIQKLKRINEDVMFVKGVDRLKVRSVVSPETRFVIINEEGFDWGPVVPFEFPQDSAGRQKTLDKIRENITLAGLKGRLVSMDMKSALITGEVYETGVNYLSVYHQLNEIRQKYSSNDVSLHINGFAMVVGFVNDALYKIVSLFGLSIIITFLILWRAFRVVRLALLPLVSAGLAVLWTLGIIQLSGKYLDPMTSIVPFLVFSIGVSHGIQMVKRYLEECGNHPEGYNAALHALAGLLIPGTIALLTDLIGFLTIFFVPIGVIRDLATTASVGMGCIVISNVLFLTLILSFFPNLLTCVILKSGKTPKETFVKKVMAWISLLTYGKNAYRVAAVAVLVFCIGLAATLTMRVGDVNPGEPLLWKDSVYNKDAAKIMTDFLLGVDYLSVVVAGEEDGICKNPDILSVVEDYEWHMWHYPGVTFVVSPLILARAANEMLHEGDIRWRTWPKTSEELATVMSYVGSTDDTEFMTMGCQNMNVRLFLRDHKGDTIRNVIQESKKFFAAHPLPGAKFVLAGGNAGVMGATNEQVNDAQIPMLLLIYASTFILCLVMFRSLSAPFFIMTPLLIVSLISSAFMKAFGLGLNVNTLPVASMGVGVGVDYGIYIYARLMEERGRHARLEDAICETLQTTGAAVLYTAMTLSAGVFTWLLSDLKFQADMGVLLGFLFVFNMIGAMVLLPTLVYIFNRGTKKAQD